MIIKTEMSGFKDFDKVLNKLPKNIENRVLQKSTNKAMRAGLRDMKAAAPVHKRGEQSKASIEYKSLKRNLKVKRLRRTSRGQKASRIDTGKAFWGVFFELGTRSQPARPWFLPAFQKAQTKVLDTLKIELGKGIEDEAKKLARTKK